MIIPPRKRPFPQGRCSIYFGKRIPRREFPVERGRYPAMPHRGRKVRLPFLRANPSCVQEHREYRHGLDEFFEGWRPWQWRWLRNAAVRSRILPARGRYGWWKRVPEVEETVMERSPNGSAGAWIEDAGVMRDPKVDRVPV